MTLEAVIMNTASATVEQFRQTETLIPLEAGNILNGVCRLTDSVSEENAKANEAFDVQRAAYSNIPTSKLFSLGERTIIGQ
jgi:hypothetical protein